MHHKPNFNDFFSMAIVLIICLICIGVIIFKNDEFNSYMVCIFLVFLYVVCPVIVIIIIYRSKQKIKFNYNYKNILNKENIPSKFEKIYNELYNKDITELEQLRKRILLKKGALWIFLIIVIVITLLIYSRTPNAIGIIYSAMWISPCIFIFVIFKYNKRLELQYKNLYKQYVIYPFITSLYSNLIYTATGIGNTNISQHYLNASFDSTLFNKFGYDDYIEGYLTQNLYAQIADIRVTYITRSNNSEFSEELFWGIFTIIKCNKNIESFIQIAKNEFKFMNSNIRIEMDSQEFEECFDVYSEDKVLAMRLLTSDVMDLLVNFYKKYQLDFEITLKDNNIYLRFHTGPMFEPKVFGKSINKEQLYAYYFILQFIIEITNKVDDVLKEFEV